jgi:hypothetical protein
MQGKRAQSLISLNTGLSPAPRSVSLYSTCGGTVGWAILFELAELLAQHLLGNSRHHLAELKIAHDRLVEQTEDDP